MAVGRLTTHVLDTMRGCPAAGLAVALFRMERERVVPLVRMLTNADGRCAQPLLQGEAFMAGVYELRFAVGGYFARGRSSAAQGEQGVPFLDEVPVRFGIDDPSAHYHVPLLVSPFAYSTYRGS